MYVFFSSISNSRIRRFLCPIHDITIKLLSLPQDGVNCFLLKVWKKMATLKSLVGLNDSRFSQILKEKRSKQTIKFKKVRNLLTTIDHYLISWENEDCCLLVKNLLDVDSSWAEKTKNCNKKSPVDRFLVSYYIVKRNFYCRPIFLIFFCLENFLDRFTYLSSWKHPSERRR